MATVIELMASGSGTSGYKGQRRRLDLMVLGTEDDAVMHAAIQDAIEDELQITFRGANQLLFFQNYEHEYQGGGVYKVNVSYAMPEPQGQDDGDGPQSEYQFDTTGATVKVTQALSHISTTVPSGWTASDHGGAINVVDGKPEGVDIPIPAFAWTETHYFTDAYVTEAYKLTVASLTGSVNSGTWRGNAAGSVKFMGARGSKRGRDQWQITYLFEYSPNKTSIVIGGGSGWPTITVPAKKGWEYMWIEYEIDEDTTGKQLSSHARAAHVEKVLEEGDFDLLGLGG